MEFLSSLKNVDQQTLDQEFNMVRSQTVVIKRDLGLTTEAGALKENIKKNRYKDILPYDQSRVILLDSDSDYINASFIQGVSDRTYIASQAPLSCSLIDYWRMIWQHNVKVIVMLCREVEMGKRKCECYWAPLHESAEFGPFTVRNQGETRPNEDLVIRNLTVTHTQLSRSLVQYQFLSWPDHDVPYEASGVVDLLGRVRESQGGDAAPLLVHCSAGCGRTGVIVALDYIYDLLVSKRISRDFRILDLVLDLRRQRPSAVQTRDQYQFIFSCAICMVERALQEGGAGGGAGGGGAPHLPQKPTTSNKKRLSHLSDMSDTYAVVNKHKSLPPASGPAYATVTPRSSSTGRTPASHHYDNEPSGATPVYSTVRPRAKAPPIYDTATNQGAGEGPSPLSDSGEYHLMPAQCFSQTDDDYEDFTSTVKEDRTCSPGGIGFNCRIQKPRGPRAPPAEWSRLER